MASRYWVGGTASWNGTAGSKWALTSGGAGGQAEPTSSDDVFFDSGSGAVTVTISNATHQCNSIDCTGFTGTITGSVNGGNAIQISGNKFKLVAGMTYDSNPRYLTFLSTSGTILFTSGGKTITGAISMQGNGGTLQFQDALLIDPVYYLELIKGTIDANNQTMQMGRFTTFSTTGSRAILMGSGLWTITGDANSNWDIEDTVNLTFTKSTANLKFTATTNGTITFNGAGLTYNDVWFSRGASTGEIDINGANGYGTFKDTGTGAHTIKFQHGVTQTFNTSAGFVVSGNAGNLITITSDTTATHTLSCASGTINSDYLSIQHSVATGGATWNGGSHSTNNQAVSTAGSGWLFSITYTLTALNGSFSLTGFATTLNKYWKIICGFGSYVLTGFATTLNRHINISLTQGSYVLTGFSALLAKGHTIICGFGSYALTGFSVTWNRIINISLTTGSYVLTGFNATIGKAHTLVAGFGSYVLTGFSVTWNRVINLIAGYGVFSLTGEGITKTLTFLVGTGHYVLTGFNTTFNRVINIILGFGSYVLTGFATGLHHAKVLVAGFGSYVLTGEAVTWNRVYSMFLITGKYILKGFPARIIAPFHTIWRKLTQPATPTVWNKVDRGQ